MTTVPESSLLFPPSVGMQVHASTLLPLGDGGVLVAWFAGAHEGSADSRIHVLRRDGASEATTVITPDDDLPHWNPVLANGPDGRIWLFFRRGLRIDRWTTWVCRSGDSGLTWDEPVELVPGDVSAGRGPVRQAPLGLDGLWVAPGSVEVWEPPRWDCFMDVSPDSGGTWQRVPLSLDHAVLRGAGCIQPCLVGFPDGELVALARSTEGRVHRSATRDVRSWPPLAPTGLPNNNSGLAAVALPDGRIVAVHNDASGDWGPRSRLVCSVSGDRGLTWREVGVVDDGTRFPGGAAGSDGSPRGAAATGVVTGGEGEYSYPSAVLTGHELWVTYTWQRRSIALVRLAADL